MPTRPRIVAIHHNSGSLASYEMPLPQLFLRPGDLLLAFIGKDDDDAITTVPSGWNAGPGNTLLNITGKSYYHVLDATSIAALSSSSAPMKLTWAGDLEFYSIVMLQIRYCDTSNPIDISSTATTTSTTVVCPDITTTVNDCLLIFGGTKDNTSASRFGSHTFPAGLTQLWNADEGSNVGVDMAFGYEYQATAGATGTRTFTFFNTAGDTVAYSIAIAPGPSDTISGTVTNAESPVAGAKVVVVIADDLAGANMEVWETATTDGSGDWSSDYPAGKVAHAFCYHEDTGDLFVSQNHLIQ